MTYASLFRVPRLAVQWQIQTMCSLVVDQTVKAGGFQSTVLDI